jgi:glycine/D-amino acid oxidase-like deaminating enzyme
MIVATNARLPELVPSLASFVTAHRAQMLATAAVPMMLDRPCYAGGGYDYFRQRGDGRVLLGGRRHLFFEAERTTSTAITDDVQRALDAYLEAHLAFARGAAIDARWAGTMGFSADGLPLAGRAPNEQDTWVLGGFTGHGLGLALALADHLADAIVDPSSARARDAVLTALRPDRFVAPRD